jgi:hypothetical protein
VADDIRTLHLTKRELGLLLKYGYPDPDDTEMLRSSKVQNGMHVAHIDSFWLSMWIADIVRSAKKIRSQGWDKDERVDRLLFQSQLASADFFGRELNPEASDPQL